MNWLITRALLRAGEPVTQAQRALVLPWLAWSAGFFAAGLADAQVRADIALALGTLTPEPVFLGWLFTWALCPLAVLLLLRARTVSAFMGMDNPSAGLQVAIYRCWGCVGWLGATLAWLRLVL